MNDLSPIPPQVSVVIPTFGRPQLVCRAVRSALAQTFENLEVVVVIDGDDPATIEALRTISDPRLRQISYEGKRGAGRARDTGAEAAVGEWVAFLDDDDEWLPEKIERQIAAMPPDGRAIGMTLYIVAFAHGQVVHPTRPYDGAEPIDEWLFGRKSWFGGGESMVQTSGLIMPRKLFGELKFGTVRHEEWELVIRAVKQHGYALVTVKEPLVIYYALNTTYPWRPSLEWIKSVRDVVTPRALAGFCLTVATQGLVKPDRNAAAMTLLRTALRYGKPTARQLFAFLLIWLTPYDLRHRVRVALRKMAFPPLAKRSRG